MIHSYNSVFCNYIKHGADIYIYKLDKISNLDEKCKAQGIKGREKEIEKWNSVGYIEHVWNTWSNKNRKQWLHLWSAIGKSVG